jgi:hypothetical protein
MRLKFLSRPTAATGAVTSARFLGVQFFPKDLLGRSIDWVTDRGLRPKLRPFIAAEAVHA